MKTTTILLALFLLLAPAPCLSAHETIIAMTESNAPFNYEENGRAVGIFPDLLLHMTQMAGISLTRSDIKFWPWAWSYDETRHSDNGLLFATARVRERETHFQWIGPVLTLDYKILARKDRHVRIDDLATDLPKYAVGTIRASVSDNHFTSLGVELPKLTRLNNMTLCMRMLREGRLDAIVFNSFAMLRLARTMGVDLSDYEFVHTLFTVDMYFAASKTMPAPIVDKLQKALDRLKADGTADAISRHYQ